MIAASLVSQDLESYGVRTFSAKEMAFNSLGLMHPLLFSITQIEPIWADLNGGMDRLPDLADITPRIRSEILKKSDSRRAIARDNAADFKVIDGDEAERVLQTVYVTPRANSNFDFPTLPSAEALQGLSNFRGLIDLDKVIVNTGFAEVGPWGSSRTRWEMEVRGDFTLEGWVEKMAWIVGCIKHFDGRLKNGSLYVGWVESKSGELVDEKDLKDMFEKDILAHAGVRLMGKEYIGSSLSHSDCCVQSRSYGEVMTPKRRYSTRKSNSSTSWSWSWSPWKSLRLTPRSSRTSMVPNVTYGRARVASGS
jgi:fatty acid synthase subunit alpha